MVDPKDRLRLIDVGGAGGVHPHWLRHAQTILPVLFEPNPAEAAKLRESLTRSYPAGLVIETGLSHIAGAQTLHIARYWGCTSLRRPNDHVLSKYRIGPIFDVVDTTTVTCARYDMLHHAGEVPTPDAIKIDVQGFEYEVLQGFGGLLQDCLAIELETHVYPIYRDQKLLHDLIGFLADFGFVLRRLAPVPSFDGDVVELDVWFTKDRAAWNRLSPGQRAKFTMICESWALIDYARIDPAGDHMQLAP
jgi:FkbM family methyltransferase